MTEGTSAADGAEIEDIALARFGLPELRPGQVEAIAALAAGRDALVVWATGSGKSAVYQVAGAIREGVTIVVSPLIALQEDQLIGLAQAPDAPTAVALNSTRGVRARAEAWKRLRAGDARYVFLAPEQLANDDVVDELTGLEVGLVAIDEAHCITSWGHDFRPDYLTLGAVVERLGRPPIVALTATASTPVREEIVRRLGLRDPAVLLGDVDRPGIRLQVSRHSEEREKRAAVLEEVRELPKPGLVYVATRRAAEEYATDLTESGLRARAYHAGLRASERAAVHEEFAYDALDVVVATSAFGMGIDKENVRFVVHADIPDSIDAYYQEVGRAGRDGAPAQATLHYREEDLALRRFFATKSPDGDELRALLAALGSGLRKKPELAEATGLSPRRLTALLALLVDTAAARVTRVGAALRRGVDPEAAVDAALERVEERERIDRSRIDTMREYAETRRCRRLVLLGYFGQELDNPCGLCDTCESGSATDAVVEETDDAVGFRPDERVEHREWGAGTVVSLEGDRIRVFFESEGYKMLSLEIIEREQLLRSAG